MDEILSHKEFQLLKYKPGDKLPIKTLHFGIQQLFVARWIMRMYKRDMSNMIRCLFLIHDMGSGKTITSLYSSSENRDLYKLLGAGNIIVISFQKNTFMNELLSRPELGYISNDEYDKIKRLEQSMHTDYGLMNYNNYISYLKKRIMGLEGMIRFIGYQELHNMLFVNLQGGDEVSQEVLKLFSGAFIICDEIHNAYNSQEMNIYGAAIKYILNHYYGHEDEPTIIFMSGTPINNKPSEIIDIINLISKHTLKKSDFFSGEETERLLPGALGRISEYTSGYFSFYKNEDVAVIPRKIFDGVRHGALHFIRCDYTELQAKIINELKDKIGLEDHNIFDCVFPLSSGYFYKNNDFARIELESIDWKNKHGIDYNGQTLIGNILLHKNIKQWSQKYYTMLETLDKFILDDARRGKVLIYHEFINGTGVKLIEQILIANGYLSESGVITDKSRCSKCGKTFDIHKKLTTKIIHSTSLSSQTSDPIQIVSDSIFEESSESHIFEPIRFLSVYGELDKHRVATIMDLYNSEFNRDGYKYMILIGSEMIREGYNFKCVRELWIMHLLPHISAMLQLWGRAIRMYSHDLLPPEKREVHIKIFATPGEIERYERKMKNYQVIQEIMRVIHSNAIDTMFYYDLIKKSFLSKTSKTEIGLLPYDRRVFKYKHVKLDTYNVFYGEWEVEEIKKIIISLFIKSPAWSYADLYAAVRDPPFIQNIDYSKINEDNFILALGDMIYGTKPKIITKDGVNYKILSVTSRDDKPITYYVIYPVEEVTELPVGKKIENISGRAVVNYLSWLQPEITNKYINIRITENLINLNTNYDEMKRKFFNKYKDVAMLEIPQSTEIYGLDFHIRLIEESIMYIFNLLTHQNDIQSEYHEFYFKMAHFYNKIDLIIYANMLPPKYVTFYDKYIEGVIDIDQLLISNLSNASSSSLSSFEITGINKYIKQQRGKRVAANLLPVGHMLTTTSTKFVEPKLYTPQGWFMAKDFIMEREEFKENDIIIGYYSRIENSINFKFKLRPPLHKIEKKSDRRELEKGMVCETINKPKLEQIAKELGIIATGTNIALCDHIKELLLHRELKERNKYRRGKIPTRTRWCYLQYEAHH